MSTITYQLSPFLQQQTTTLITLPDSYDQIRLPFDNTNITYSSGSWGVMINQCADIEGHIYEEQYFEPLEDMEVSIIISKPLLALHCMLNGNIKIKQACGDDIDLKEGKQCLHYIPSTGSCYMILLAGEKYHYFYIIPDIHFLEGFANDYIPLQLSIQAINTHSPVHQMLPVKRLSIAEHSELSKMKTCLLRGNARIAYYNNRISDIILLYLEQLDLPVSRDLFLVDLYEKEINALLIRIETSPEELFPVAALAYQIGVSEHTLETAFKLKRGTTLLLYVQQQRLNVAKQLLSGTDETIAGVAFKVGYADQSYFSKLFKRETGSTPSDYRKDNTSPF
ncbi:AraC-type DNA-binding protein [Chitinophaga sp. CF118]|uniref:helix-turn-helix domain-containing protein n=1 Tax=Chitinophaga sp. CF118 TaxID=1884367 RepID=UPI0008E3F1C9|nr:AraC family transcriptional regulator [Chitinophaga sp. CF118]SFE17715.1 AraC-type DNA-binding protein [Chitinophaga sp. CF118]